MGFLYKLERKFGKYAIPNLPLIIIITYAVGYMLHLLSKGMITDMISLNPYAILHGQVWRLITWIFIPPSEFGFFTVIMLYFYYSISKTLESTWGTFYFNLYFFMGIFFTALGAFAMYGYCEFFNPEFVSGFNAYEIIHTGEECTWIKGGSWFYCHAANMYSTYYMNMAIFLAFAATYPETTVLLMFIIPVKMKVLGIFDALYMIYLAFELSIGGTPFGLFVIGASLLNFLVFFALTRKGMRKSPQMRKRQKEFKRKMREIRYERDDRRIAKHKCAICGRTSEDYPNLEFRFCSKCEGNYEFCEDHLFTHKHFKRSDMSNSTNNDKDVMGGTTPNGDKL